MLVLGILLDVGRGISSDNIAALVGAHVILLM